MLIVPILATEKLLQQKTDVTVFPGEFLLRVVSAVNVNQLKV